jgi:hypothetical protein
VAEPVIRITLPSNSAMGASRVLHRGRAADLVTRP